MRLPSFFSNCLSVASGFAASLISPPQQVPAPMKFQMPPHDRVHDMAVELMGKLGNESPKTCGVSDLPPDNKTITLTIPWDGKTRVIVIDVFFTEQVLSINSCDGSYGLSKRLFDVLHHIAQKQGFKTLQVKAQSMDWTEFGFEPSKRWLDESRESLALLYLKHLGAEGKLLRSKLPWLDRIIDFDHTQGDVPRRPLVMPSWEGELAVDNDRAPPRW
jgi:hypothetical protein